MVGRALHPHGKLRYKALRFAVYPRTVSSFDQRVTLGVVDQRLAVQGGDQLYTDSASSYPAPRGYMHEVVKHTRQA